ncbi:MAG: MFS transporter, partial [Afipia sp.]|nr:MFS transporter [Afipia sp.]
METAASSRRALALFCLAYAILGLNIAVMLVYGPLYIRQQDPARGDLLVGLLLALPSLTAFLGHNLWGIAYDQAPAPRRFVLLALFSETVFFTSLLAMGSPAALVWLATVFSFFSTALFPAAQAWCTLAWEDQKGSVLGKLHAAESAGWAAGAVAGGVLSHWAGDIVPAVRMLFGLCLFCSAAAFALVAVAFPRLPAKRAGSPRSLLTDLGVLYRRREVVQLSVFLFIVTSANVAFFTYVSVYLCTYLRGAPELLSASMTAATVGGALIFPVYGWLTDKAGPRALLYGSLTSYVFFYGLLCMVTKPAAVALL